MGKVFSVLFLSAGLAAGAAAQKPPTLPANETRFPAPVRSVHSMGKDWKVPMCPARFHDSLGTNGIAGPRDKDVTQVKIEHSVPALITQKAIAASGKTHIGNYLVIVNVVVGVKGIPRNLCLQKSSGYGLDASAAAAVAQYRFDPAKKNGEPVRMRVPVEVRFVSATPTPMGTPPSGEPPQ